MELIEVTRCGGSPDIVDDMADRSFLGADEKGVVYAADGAAQQIPPSCGIYASSPEAKYQPNGALFEVAASSSASSSLSPLRRPAAYDGGGDLAPLLGLDFAVTCRGCDGGRNKLFPATTGEQRVISEVYK